MFALKVFLLKHLLLPLFITLSAMVGEIKSLYHGYKD